MAYSATIDSSILVALLDHTDVYHKYVLGLDILNDSGQVILLDFILQETLTVLCRRAHQKKNHLLRLRVIDAFKQLINGYEVIYIGATSQDYFPEIIAAMKRQSEFISFHDYWLVFAARDLQISTIVSLDRALNSIAPRNVRIVPEK